jgi:MATE family multidrug resistance protein
MVSLELWYYTAVLILVGLLKDAKLQVDVMSVWYVTNFTNSLL